MSLKGTKSVNALDKPPGICDSASSYPRVPGAEPMSDTPEQLSSSGEARRAALRLGAVGAATMITIRPALAQTMASVSKCQIPVPDPARAGNYIAADGTLVPPGTAGSFAPAGRAFTGEEVKRALGGGSLPGTAYNQSQAYMAYIRRLQIGQSGFTCFASIQMPR